MSTAEPSFLQGAFRSVMAAVCTPVAVVTGIESGVPHGTTVSAFASLSMDPPMVLVALDNGSELLRLVRSTRRFGLNVLATGQSELALTFARKGPGKFAGVPWDVEGDVPRLPDGSGFLACEVTDLVAGGDHMIVLGTVRVADTIGGAPLTYHGRTFGTHTTLVAGAGRP
jgi:flavin reductase (DIM6/NTAB) family NADH-FMN oxidoreductase RutF